MWSEKVSKEVTLVLNLEGEGVCSSKEGEGKVFLLLEQFFSSTTDSLGWVVFFSEGLPCALYGIYPHPWPLLIRYHPLSCGNQNCLQTLPDIPYGAESPWLRAFDREGTECGKTLRQVGAERRVSVARGEEGDEKEYDW